MCQSNQNLNLPPPFWQPMGIYCCLCPGGQGIWTLPRWDISTKSVKTFQCSAHLLMEELKVKNLLWWENGLERNFYTRVQCLPAKKTNSSTKNQYVTLLSSTTFIDNTKNHSMVGGAFESNFCLGGGGGFAWANLQMLEAFSGGNWYFKLIDA